MPEPIPRPTRLRPVFAFFGARRLDRFFAIDFLAHAPGQLDLAADSRFQDRASNSGSSQPCVTRHYGCRHRGKALLAPEPASPSSDPDQMRNRLHHAANGLIVHPLHDLVQPRESKTLDHKLMLDRGARSPTGNTAMRIFPPCVCFASAMIKAPLLSCRASRPLQPCRATGSMHQRWP